ncbi:MAG: hypothetical protein V4613_13390 [Bacteroidota bacterium]
MNNKPTPPKQFTLIKPQDHQHPHQHGDKKKCCGDCKGGGSCHKINQTTDKK